MNKRSLQAREANLSSRRAAEDAIESSKNDQNVTWEEAAKRTVRKPGKWRRQSRGRSAADAEATDESEHGHTD
jgi:hypothetical protein